MCSAPVLALPNFQLPFTLKTDAFGFGIGTVLMQGGRPIVYYSQALGPKAATQSTYYKEALAILQALKKWRHYFFGGKLIIKIDQETLKFMMSQRLSEGIQHKLMLELLEFDYHVEYTKGKENIVADALSRKELEISAISLMSPAWVTEIEASYIDDAHCTDII
jgi:hypothetical protein